MTNQLPPSYWINQIRADLERRRRADHNPTAVAAEQARRHPTPKETDDE